MTPKSAITIETLVAAYNRLGSVKKVGAEVGLCPQNVHKRLAAIGAVDPINVLTPEDEDRLVREYVGFRNMGQLAALAASMGRTKPFLCRKARELGLTNIRGPRLYAGKWKYMTVHMAGHMLDNFKSARGTMREYCARNGLDELGFSRTMKQHFPDEWESVIESKAPRQTMYRLGRSLEYRVRDDFKAHGWPLALRSPASKGVVDIIAIKPGHAVFVQCKRGGALGVEEWNTFLSFSLACGALPLMASCPTGRGVVYHKLLEMKGGKRRPQPMTVWSHDDGAAVVS